MKQEIVDKLQKLLQERSEFEDENDNFTNLKAKYSESNCNEPPLIFIKLRRSNGYVLSGDVPLSENLTKLIITLVTQEYLDRKKDLDQQMEDL